MTVSRADPMGLAEFSRALDSAKATIDGLLPPVAAHARQIARDLNHAARRSKEQADVYGAKATAAVDLERVAALVRRGALAALKPREARAAARRFLDLDLGQPELRALLKHNSSLGGAFARQLFAEWERGRHLPRWNKYVSLLEELRIGLPIRASSSLGPRELLSEQGPGHIARTARADSLPSVFSEFCNRGLSARWAYSHHAALDWLIKEGDSAARFSVRIAELLQWEHAALLLPLKSAGSSETRICSVGAILAQLFQLRMDVPSELERILVEGSFGDPRNILSKDWEEVRKLSRGGFEAFTLGLIREDLRFFFSHAMKEEDRGRFWLRYLGSIRRTVCILDSETHRSVNNAARTLDENARMAARRALATDDVGVSAFCLVFDNWVAIEFSKTGNATYVYRREDFEQTVLPPTRKRPRLTHLKQKELAEGRLVHNGDWQSAFRLTLERLGIRPDSARR
jgi:hypothetical protein